MNSTIRSDGIPVPSSHSSVQRWSMARKVARALSAAYGDQLSAVGVYGSTARGEDRDFSDLEMLALVRGGEAHQVDEWIEAGLKIKLHRYTPDAALRAAGTIGIEHCLERSRYQHLRAVAGNPADLVELACVAAERDPRQVAVALRALLLGEMFELECKLRNLNEATDGLALAAMRCAEFGALALGLFTNAVVPSRSCLLACSQQMPTCPPLHAQLSQRVLAGHLAPSAELLGLVLSTLEQWRHWAQSKGLQPERWTERPSFFSRSLE